jgi:hypothetical protein
MLSIKGCRPSASIETFSSLVPPSSSEVLVSFSSSSSSSKARVGLWRERAMFSEKSRFPKLIPLSELLEFRLPRDRLPEAETKSSEEEEEDEEDEPDAANLS